MTGKGRDDLTDIAILRAAEEVPNDLLVGQAQSIQVLAEKIRSSIQCFRLLLQKYKGNMDAVDPQLKNNQELIQIVELYETSWAAGKEQLLDKTQKEQIIKFCINIESLGQKYPNFKEQVECSEAEIFLSIPTLMVFKAVQQDTESHIH